MSNKTKAIDNAVQKFEERKRAAAERYILANPSDPFVRGRVEAHLRNGIVGYNDHGDECFYDAKSFQESRRLPLKEGQTEGDEYFVTVWKDVKMV